MVDCTEAGGNVDGALVKEMQTHLLAADLLILAVLTYIIYRILFAAHRLAEKDRLPAAGQQVLGRVHANG